MSAVSRFFRALEGTLGDLGDRVGDQGFHDLLRAGIDLAPAAVGRALPWLVRTREGRNESLMAVVEGHARTDPHGLAFEMGDERLGWATVDERSSQLAHVLWGLGVRPGDVVALVGKNSPSYLVSVLGISRLGAVAALVNWHLEGAPLAHAIVTSKARVALVDASLIDAFAAQDELGGKLDHVLVYGRGDLDERMRQAPSTPFPRVPVNVRGDFVYIYTSGTTGLPKPCRVSHGRMLMAGAGFGNLMFRFGKGDKLYCVLPLYHSSALMIGAGSCIMTRTPLALRDGFSASAFWPDVHRYRATAMLYIGELCRYLLNSEPRPEERGHRLRVAVGNGLRADVWEPFAERFSIPEIREFYSATEAPGIIFNITGKVGSVGYVPLRRFSAMKLVRYDVDQDELVRDERGLCIECSPGEVGHLLIRLKDNPTVIGDFRGYTDDEATRRKVVENVLEPGDRFFLSGDLLRYDDSDYFYFVDRVGDTYRWKGENVSTAEVAEVVSKAPGVLGASVTSVQVPGHEGRAGLAAILCDGAFDTAGFWNTVQELPTYAQPRFVRILERFDTTGTFKIQKGQLRADGVDPAAVSDPLYLRRQDGYVALTPQLFAGVMSEEVRL